MVGADNLDASLLRFRNDPADENAGVLAEALLAAGRGSEALEVASMGLEGSTDQGRLLVVAGKCWLQTGDLLRAQKALLKAARVDAKNKEPYRWLGEVLMKRGDPERAAKVLERAARIDTSDRAIQVLLGRAQRLARIAQTTGEPQKLEEPKPPPDDYEDRTVVRPEISARLADKSRGDLRTHDPHAPPPARVSGEPETTVRAAPAPLPMPVELPKPAPKRTPVVEEEEAPTSLMSRAALSDMARGGDAPSSPFRTKPSEERRLASSNPPGDPANPGSSYDMGAPSPFDEPDPTMTDIGALPSPAASPAPLVAGPPLGAAAFPLGGPPPVAPPPRAPAPAPVAKPASVPARPLSKPPPSAPAPSLGGPPASLSGMGIPQAPLPRIEAPIPPAPEPPDLPDFGAAPGPGLPELGLPDLGGPPAPAPAFAPAPAAPQPATPQPSQPAAKDYDFDPPSVPEVPPDVLGDFAPPPVTAPDLSAGDKAGATEDVEGILRMLEQQSIFEPPAGEPVVWATKKEVHKTGVRIGRTLVVLWVLGIAMAGGGYFGWTKWVAAQHAEADELVAQARLESRGGDHRDLIDAERHLRAARDLNPLETTGPELLLFIHAQRALEDGAFEPGYLMPAIERGEDREVGPAYLAAARAVVAAANGNMEEAGQLVDAALEAGGEEAAILYLAGRLEQRLGDEDALTHLAEAVEAEPGLVAASIALAEARADEGQPEIALALVEAVLADDAEHIRGRLWKLYLTADDAEPGATIGTIDAMAEELEQHGAPTDNVLAYLTKARLMRRMGQADNAEAAVDQAAQAGATEPRLLALVAAEARSLGQLSRAQQAAMAAVAGAPTNTDFRKLLAEVLIARRDGVRALRTLGSMTADDPDVLRLSAYAALLVGTPEALQATAEALGTFLEGQEEPSVEMRALHIRAKVALGQGAEVLRDARQLAREAVGDPMAAQALGEAALAARNPRLAKEALTRLTAAAPDNAEGHFLLGRAHRMGGDSEEAEASFRRALELSESHTDATIQLGYLLLDQGKFEEADAIYQGLARRSRVASGASTVLIGRLGRVEALLGLGRIDDAQVQYESIRTQDRESGLAKVVGARLALAQRRPGEAVAALRPLASHERASPDTIALFGDALYAAEEPDAAMAQYERGLLVDRAHPELLLGYARVLIRSDKSREALDILDRARVSLESRIRAPRVSARMHLLVGRAHVLKGPSGLVAARRALRRAVAIEGCPSAAWFWLGESLAGDNSPESREAYERYLELAPAGPLAARARRAIN